MQSEDREAISALAFPARVSVHLDLELVLAHVCPSRTEKA